MLENSFIGLSGYGRLHDIGYDKDGEACVTLHLINGGNGRRADDLWVECQVDMCDFPEVAKFEDFLALGKSVTVKFDAQYLSFQQCYSGMAENDPNHIVHLQGRLLSIHECYVEDDNTVAQHNHGINKQIVSHRLRA
jgi:hypothetical protein